MRISSFIKWFAVSNLYLINMSPFEYVTVLISIVLGLGITQIVTGVADLIQQWSRVKIFWPHLLLIVLVFFLHIQEWWIVYELKDTTEWRLPVFLFTILYPIHLFILARILFPPDYSTAVDFQTFYFANYRRFFLVIGLLATLSILDNLLQHRPIAEQLFHTTLLIVMITIAVKKYQQVWLHQAVTLLLVCVMLGSFIYNWNRWVLTP